MKGGEGGQVGKGCLGGKVKFYERTRYTLQTIPHTSFSDVINPPSLIADSILEMSAL